MATIEEWIEENVKPNVLEVGDIRTAGQPEKGIITYDVGVFIKVQGENSAIRATQVVYQIGEEFYFGSKIVKNYVEPEATATEEEILLAKFQAIEAETGTKVKVDVQHLALLGVKYFVFAGDDNVKKVTATLAGVDLTREVA